MIIGICEDRKEDSIRIEKACMNFIKDRNGNFQVKKFQDGQEVLEYEDKLDLLFLDIEMPNVDGIKVKNQFQKHKKNTMILYVTIHDEMMMSAFGVNVFGFIPKESLEHGINRMLPSAMEILQNYVMIDEYTDSRDVVFIKSEGVYCRLVMEDGSEKIIRSSMKRMEEILCCVGYIRTHKSYLVNPKWISKWDGGVITTCRGEVPVSGRLRAKAKKEYMAYCEKYAGYC